MFNQIGNIVSCYAIDENGTRIEFGKVSGIEIEYDSDGSKQASITISPNKKGELFTMTIPEKGEKELNGTIVYCRFENAKGEFSEHTKKYAYYVATSPEDCVIKEGTIFKVWDTDKKIVEYNGTSLRCYEVVGVENKADAELIESKPLKTIEKIKIAGEIVSTDKKHINPWVLNKIEDNATKTVVVQPVSFSLGIPSETNGYTISDEIKIISKGITSSLDDKLYDGSEDVYGCDRNEINTINSGGNDMNTDMFGSMFKNMKFGKIKTDEIKYSMKGIAIQTNARDYVCYNPDLTFTNVGNMVMDMPVFAMPVSKEQIKVGDVIDHNGTWVIVNSVTPTEIKVARPYTKEIVSVIPETSIFGFSFYTKVINPFENLGATATADNPFGNMLPLMLMSGGDTKNSNDMLMMMLAFGGGKVDFSNPMMMYMLMGDKGNTNDMLMMMMLSGNNPFEQKQKHEYGYKAGDFIVTPTNSIDPYFGVDYDWTTYVQEDGGLVDTKVMDVED